MIAAPHGRSWWHYVVGMILNVAVFVAIGPIVGALCFVAVSVAWVAGTSGMLDATWVGPFMFLLPISIVVAYLKGWLAAGSTGLLVAVASAWVVNALALYAMAITTGGALSFLCLWLGERTVGEDAGIAAVVFLVGAVAAGVCTRMASPFRLSKPVSIEVAPASRAV